MLMYDYKRGMQRCIFVDIDDPSFTCQDCEFYGSVCDGEFMKKYGIQRRFENGTE